LTGKDGVADLHALLAAADVAGPYLLLGASFGGLLADMYAATYPDDVVGMVLLDALLPDYLTHELRYIPTAHRELKPNIWKQDPEQYDLLTTFRQALALQGNEPSVPVTYIGIKRFDIPRSWPYKVIHAAGRKNQRDFVARFSPGRLIIVDTPHYMEPVIPGRIAREVKRVIANSTEG
jgi:pimeloyl-ACP methyl ester carboxylesterase